MLGIRPALVAVVVRALLAGCSTATTNDWHVDNGVGTVTPSLGLDCDSYAADRTAPPTPDLTPLPADSVLASATSCI
jgi:hypothetical protein